jgi:chloramphenicol O-acetyltransferase type B
MDRPRQEARRAHADDVMTNYFESPFLGIPLDRQVTNPNIVVGRYSYYSGYYHGHGFDECARYLSPEPGADRLSIGSFCSIGTGAAFIMAGNQGHRNEWISTFPFHFYPDAPEFEGARNGYLPAGDTVIGNDVWIGAEAIVMPGVTVGDGAVIGTRALVTRDVEPYAIVGGNPARTIRKRFDDARIAILLEMRWWDWSADELREAMPLLTDGDVGALHRHWRRARTGE